MTLREIIRNVEELSDDLVIFATKGDFWQIDASASLIVDSDVDSIGIELEEQSYFLEVQIAQDVLNVWRKWNSGREPDEKQRIEALIYYADNDAYLNPHPRESTRTIK